MAAFGANPGIAAERYPTKPVRIVVPYPPGGGSDIIARILGLKLGEAFGQPIVIENRPGAASMVATEMVAKARADGYTLILSDAPHTINVTTYANASYDAVKDFSPIIMVGTTPQILVAHPSFPANSLRQLLAMPRAETQTLAMGTGGAGSSPHMTYELLRLRTGLVLNHVPYKGGGPAMADAVAGQIPLAFTPAPAAATYLRTNRLKGLGITSAERHASFPTIPTFIEAGVPNFTASHWYGVLAPNGTPRAVIDSLNAEILKTLQMPDVRERFASLAIDVAAVGPAEFSKIMQADVQRWREVVKKSGIRVE